MAGLQASIRSHFPMTRTSIPVLGRATILPSIRRQGNWFGDVGPEIRIRAAACRIRRLPCYGKIICMCRSEVPVSPRSIKIPVRSIGSGGRNCRICRTVRWRRPIISSSAQPAIGLRSCLSRRGNTPLMTLKTAAS